MKQGTEATFCWECKPETRTAFRSVDRAPPNWFWISPCSWPGKGEQAEQHPSLPRQCQPGSVGQLPSTGSQAGAAAPPLAPAGLALGSSIAHSLGSKFSSQPDSTVDFFLALPVRQITPQSTTFRLLLHDIPWKGALLPLSGMPAQPAGSRRLGTRARVCCKRDAARTSKELLAATAPGAPTPLHPGSLPRCRMRGSSGAPISRRCATLRGASCGPQYAASSY